MKFSMLAFIVTIILCVEGASLVEKNYNNQPVERCVIPGVVALTFDDGPFWQTYKVLDVLRYKNVTATFFINGANWMDITNPNATAITQMTLDEGHTVESHTWSHPNLTENRSVKFIEDELNHMTNELIRIFGIRPWAMRPPFGEYNNTVLDIVGGLGYGVIMWSINTTDWLDPGNITHGLASYVENMNGTDPESTLGFISLHHDTLPYSDVLAEAAINYVRSLGYRLVSLSECLGMSDKFQTPGYNL